MERGLFLLRRGVLAGLAAACAPTLALAERAQPPLPPALSQLGSLALAGADGAPTTLGDNLGAAASIISFWASWCAPCIDEARFLARIRLATPGHRLNIVGINIDSEPRREADIARFLARARVNYTQLRGGIAAVRAFGETQAVYLPRLYIFGADGAPSAAFCGFAGAASLRPIQRAIDRALR